MVDDRRKPASSAGDARNRMEDRTVPVPVPRGVTRSADTLEADPQSFIGDEHLQGESGEPAETRAPPTSRSAAPAQPSFDEEIAKNRAPAPRSAAPARRAGLDPPAAASNASPTEHEPPRAPRVSEDAASRAAAETSDPSSSGVFASRASAVASTNRALADAARDSVASALLRTVARESGASAAPLSRDEDAATLPIDAPTLPLITPRDIPSPLTTSAAPLESDVSSAPPAAPTAATSLTAAHTGPQPDLQTAERSAEQTVERTAAVPVASLVPGSDPAAALPQRIDPAERERLANEATRIRSAPHATAPGSSGRGLKSLLLLLGFGVVAAATAAGVRAVSADQEPSVPTPAPLARADTHQGTVAAGGAPASAGESAAHGAVRDGRTRPLRATALEAGDAPNALPDADTDALADADTDALPGASAPTRRAFLDRSGSGAIGVAQALEAGVRPALGTAGADGLMVRGEVARADVALGRASVDCTLTVADQQRPRITLQASAHASENGQRADRLLRMAAQRCGESLRPELQSALSLLARR